jgi:acrylyl-CoA reductase (NADPH)
MARQPEPMEKTKESNAMFRALYLQKDQDGFSATLAELDEARLPALEHGGVLVRPEYSTINYKDALAVTDTSPVVRRWPMVPGIDGAGVVVESDHPSWKVGDRFIHNGWGVGETHWGCLSQRARLSGDGLIPLPAAFTTRQAMAIGTAGYTAMLCVLALERHGLAPSDGDVLVTGATGGVGSIAVALLSRLGYRVVASTGKSQADYLERLGAVGVIDRAELSSPGKPLQKERWAAVVDAVGGHTLANACSQVRYGGAIAACGLAQSHELPATVMPFILRGVSLIGVDSVMAALALRRRAWERLATDLDPSLLEAMVSEIGLGEVIEGSRSLVAGQVRGRFVVRID